MDAVKNIITNVPNWIDRLNELLEQIDKRQAELAELAASQGSSSPETERRSLRPTGSTESLRPRDDGDGPQIPDVPLARKESARTASPAAHPPLEREISPLSNEGQPPASPASGTTPSALLRQSQNVMAEVSARARATVRRRQRSDSVMSAQGAPKYRSRSLIIVYYDSYVQSFFEELVKFVSASRNMMRKAKMAAKVAQIKKLAELEMPDPDDDDEENKRAAPEPAVAAAQPVTVAAPADGLLAASTEADPESGLPALQYVSTRAARAMAYAPDAAFIGGGPGRPPRMMPPGARIGGGYAATRLAALGENTNKVYDELDKGLEYVQSMCERGAHQFLRDGECTEEIEGIQGRLGEVKGLADREMDRVLKEEPESLNAPPEPRPTRSYRPHTMRKDLLGPPTAKGDELEVDVSADP
jgi:hypothetical protein